MVMSFNNIVLSMDLSLTSPGFSVLGITDEGHPLLLDKSIVKTDAKKSYGHRLNDIAVEIRRLMNEYKPEVVVKEKGFSRFPSVTQSIFRSTGAADLAVFNEGYTDNIHEISVTSVKKLVTGNGKSTKEEVAEVVFERLSIDNTDEFYTKRGKLIDDLTDSCAVGLAYYIEKGMIS